ncbi:MAG: hypothetical protein K2X43_13800 [Hyphomonadaceae bacterium]|jgi:hypothetical protein|nr:hypothetical protein [Hyphomonadaceae bacterium]
MAAALPSLYLKWLVFRELLRPPQSNAEIGTRIWGPDDGPSRFSKLLRGDSGCDPEVAAELAEAVNKRIAMVRSANKQSDPPAHVFRGSDFELPVLEFARLLVMATKVIEPDAMDRSHRALLSEFAPARGVPGPRLAIEPVGTGRYFEGATSASEGPPVFEIGRHKGLFAVEGLPPERLAQGPKVYALFARDTSMTGKRIWDVPFSEAVRWFPSPFEPTVDGARLLLMPEPKPVQPVIGHFHLTVALVFEPAVIGRLDPRRPVGAPAPLDEEETARFLTNLHRLMKSHANALAVCGGEYIVRQS